MKCNDEYTQSVYLYDVAEFVALKHDKEQECYCPKEPHNATNPNTKSILHWMDQINYEHGYLTRFNTFYLCRIKFIHTFKSLTIELGQFRN